MVLETEHVNQRQRDELYLGCLLAMPNGPPEFGFLTWKMESDDNTCTQNLLA